MVSSNPKSSKTQGSFNVTKSLRGAFSASDLSLYEHRGNIKLEGSLVISADEKVQLIFVAPAQIGASNGEFPGKGEPPYSYYLHFIEGHGQFYSADNGSYTITYDKDTQHLTGHVNFTVTSEGEQTEFEYNFDVSGFDI